MPWPNFRKSPYDDQNVAFGWVVMAAIYAVWMGWAIGAILKLW
jgi:hypothetical protein